MIPAIARAMPPMAGSEMDMMGTQDSTRDSAPVDYGFGPGKGKVRHSSPGTSAGTPYVLGSVPPGGSGAGTEGFFDPPVTWPIIGLHQILLPDGRVLNYGTNEAGQQGAAEYYDVWDPKFGTGLDAHQVLPNTTHTDIFCSDQSMLWRTGKVFITGGDMTVDNTRNYSNNHTTIFSPQNDSIRPARPMAYKRWYPSIVAMPSGEMLVLGGRTAPSDSAAITPELFNPTTGWSTLSGATSDLAFREDYGWFYPRAFLRPDGDVFLVDFAGRIWTIDTSNTGTIEQSQTSTLKGSPTLPTLMYAPGMLLSLRMTGSDNSPVAASETIAFNGSKPLITPTGPIDQLRHWSNATVLADGRVFVNGGSAVANQLPGILSSQIWDPSTGAWTAGASATIPRLYHSIALLLPDATVLTAAGGAPGPLKNLNAEIYFPPYLYLNDGSGNPAPRPTLVSAPSDIAVGKTVTATVGSTDTISRVTFVRTGSVTHSTNNDQRFIDLPFTQSGNVIQASLPGNSNVLLPGYYMMFVFEGYTPSVARIMRVQLP
jgi:galactose oxidase-like protein